MKNECVLHCTWTFDVTLHTIRLILRMTFFYKIMEKDEYKVMLKHMKQS